VPQHFASELFAEDEQHHCFVRRQPQTSAETDAMIRVVATQELGCIRYRGTDLVILRRLAETGEGGQCDVLPPPGVKPLQRDQVSFLSAERAEPFTGHAILERLLRYLATQPQGCKTTAVTSSEDEALASVAVSWSQDRFHRIELRAARSPGSWLLRHFGPPRFSDTIHDWLNSDEAFADVRWQTLEQLQVGSSWQRTPW
jgi:hypothetical protein